MNIVIVIGALALLGMWIYLFALDIRISRLANAMLKLVDDLEERENARWQALNKQRKEKE